MEFTIERAAATISFLVVFTLLVSIIYPFTATSSQKTDSYNNQALAVKDTQKNTITEVNQEEIDNFDIDSIPDAN